MNSQISNIVSLILGLIIIIIPMIITLIPKGKKQLIFAIIGSLMIIFSVFNSQKEKNELNKTVSEVRNLLEPFRLVAKTLYPNLDEKAGLQELAIRISKLENVVENMQPKLVYFHKKRHIWRDPSGLLHTKYVFGSKFPLPLSNITIEMKFNKPFENVNSSITGEVMVATSYIRMEEDSDYKGFIFETGKLLAGNYVVIEVVSKDTLNVLSMELNP